MDEFSASEIAFRRQLSRLPAVLRLLSNVVGQFLHNSNDQKAELNNSAWPLSRAMLFQNVAG